MSGAASEAGATTTSRTKDGIPTWSGEASSFVSYEEAALLWEQSLTWEKRYTAGPRLMQELTGAARRLVSGQPAGWVAYRGGVRVLMDHLRRALGKPRVNEVTDLLATYFKGTKKAQWRASKAASRPTAPTASSGWASERRSSGDWSRQWTPGPEAEEPPLRATEDGEDGSAEGSTRPTEVEEEPHDPWRSYSQTQWNPWGNWGWSSTWYGQGYQGRYDWSSWTASTTTSGGAEGNRTSELLPTFIQGWYLLMDANLDHGERNLVVTALSGNFHPQKVGQELRNQFPEGETRRRDQGRRFQSYLGEMAEDFDDTEEFYEEGNTTEELAAGGLNEEGIALVVDAEQQVQDAMAAMNDAKRTLREARFKQKQIKQNRRYYQGFGKGGRGGASSFNRVRDDSNIECLGCGQKGHRVANCPNKATATAASAEASGEPQQAPFVCFMDAVIDDQATMQKDQGFVGYAEEAYATGTTTTKDPQLTTAEAVRRGMCVIDGGATQTIGSVMAIEAILDRNRFKHGESGLSGVDSSNPPSFSFGNSTENRCLSTAKLRISANGAPGELRIHALDSGSSPVLLSIETLRRLGALIDFEHDLLVFRNLDAQRVIKLERGLTGHQLMDLTEDWLRRALPAERAIVNVTTLAQHLTPQQIVSVTVNMDSWNKPELVLFLRGYGEEPPRAWGKVELRQRIQDLVNSGEVELPTPASRNKTPLQVATTALNQASKKKGVLIKYAEENYGIRATTNDTIGTLQRKVMDQLLGSVTPVGRELMGFGKFSSRTYRQVLEDEPKYTEWAKQTAHEGQSSVYLQRFVRWVEDYADFEEPVKGEVAADHKKTILPKAKSKTPPMATKGYPTEVEGANSAGSMMASEETVKNLTMIVAQLAQEVKSMKEEKGEKPRKIVAKDAEMATKQGLVGFERPELLEIMCEPDSILSQTFQARCLRLDPAGAFRSHAIEEWCDKHQIFLDIVPGEAHWKIGTVENAIKGLKEVMHKLCLYDTEISTTEALSEAVASFNHRELIRGYSPAQHVLGQAPDETGRFVASCDAVPPGLLCESAQGEFSRSVKLRAEAEKALCEWNANQRLLRATHSRHRPCYDYQPGELVFYWRCQDATKGRRQPGGKHGRFLGPARVLAVESRKEPDSSLRPGGAIWLVKGRSLLKCSPEQLRRASQREELVESLSDTHQRQTPWTFQTVAQEIGGNRFEDISAQPDLEEWRRAQQPEEEVQPVRHRIRTKRGLHQRDPADDEEMEQQPPEEAQDQGPALRERSRSRGPRGSQEASSVFEQPAAWWSDVPSMRWPTQEASYWADEKSAVEIEIPLPDSHRGREKAWRNLGAYFVGSMKRRAVELSEKRMTAQELEAFKGAKATEVKNFVAAKAFELIPDHLRPSKNQAIGMRWILTWKLKEDGTRKPKARAVLLGYQDGSYEHRATTSPVMTRQTRQLVLQMAAWKRWKVQKGDVTGAFLQSRQYPDNLYCIPCPEICEALGVEAGTITKVQKACYGLVDAPLEWYRSVDSFLNELGLQRCWSDACCWVLREQGVLKGIICGHVDDFLFAGKTGDASWERVIQAIKEKFKWGDWEEGKFTQCGVVVQQTSEGFELSQPTYLENLHEISVNASRRKNRQDPTTDKEKTQLRALLGGISWHAQQVAPYLAAAVSLLLTEVSRSTVETIIQSNILLSHAKAKQNYHMRIHAFKPEDDIVFIGRVDAANGNRCDGGSTQGIFIGATPKEMLTGNVCGVSPVSWSSQKIDRACRSPGAAEAQAAVNGEDTLLAVRHQWSELMYGTPDLQDPSATVSRTRGCLVTDSRNVYDKLETEVMVVKGAEKRTSIEMLSLKEAQLRTGLQVRWVHSEAQLANSLTKHGGQREYDLYYKMRHRWRLVEDESMMSAKRRKDCGLQPLE
ncbi:RE1 [Symbiodinium sp. CCMP2592]|nr:RE1 [Symbiodinium sp. CCMP2592]